MRKRETQVNQMEPQDATDDPRFVTALARGLSVLRAFKRGDRMLGNQELAERTGLAKSTISRLTYTLSKLGYLEYSSSSGQYSLSASALALGFSALGSLAIRDVARPLMQELADQVGASVALGTPDQRTMIYVEECRGSSPLRLGIEIGSHIKMATSSMGRAYLAGLDEPMRVRIVDQLCAHEADPDAIRSGIAIAVAEFAEKGFVRSIGEWKQEVNSVGVPILLHGSRPFALNCGGSSLSLKTEDLNEIGIRLVNVARRIARSLGAE